MIVFFAIVAVIGLIMMFLNHASNTPDSIPTELVSPPVLGPFLLVVSVIGAGCVWAFG